jgi:hypothetical protein
MTAAADKSITIVTMTAIDIIAAKPRIAASIISNVKRIVLAMSTARSSHP